MPDAKLSKLETDRIREHVRLHPITAVVIRTEKSPAEIETLIDFLGKACRLKPVRVIWSSTSDFGLAELNSKNRILALVCIGGERTELVSLSQTDTSFIEDLEETICKSNIQSGIIREGS